MITYPGTYGVGMTPAVHAMMERHYYGYYLPATYHPYAYLADDWVHHAGELMQSNSACPVLGWVLHDVSDEERALASAPLRDFFQPLRVGGIWRADNDHRIHTRRDGLHRLLPVGGRVADVFLVRSGGRRKAFAQHRDDVRRVVD